MEVYTTFKGAKITLYIDVTLTVYTLRIPEGLRGEMRKHPEINWSEVVREAIARRIELEERLEAVRAIDEARQRVKPVEKGRLDRWIREDRER